MTDAEVQQLWLSQRSPLRAAYEEGDVQSFFAALALRCDVADGCWLWNGQTSKSKRSAGSYAIIRFGKKQMQVHRISAEMKYGNLDGQPVHHRCARTLCVNPDHLQPISHRENIAEMLQRTYYVDRIDRLERALAEFNPAHPLLMKATNRVA